jgi:AcrR family transcriptional regulator
VTSIRSPSARERIFEAAFACVARYGIAKTTVEDVAREARVSRATVYRYFSGKDDLIRQTIAWETARFFTSLADAVAGIEDLPSLLEEALFFAHQELEQHAVLQKVLQTEPELLLPELSTEAERLITLVRAFLMPWLDRATLAPSVERERAAEHVARMFLSCLGSPGSWDLADRAEVRALVQTQILAGVTRDN